MPNQLPLNPDALEAGAKALFRRERKYHTPSIECPEPPNWEDLTETSMEHYRGNARAVLAAALPEVTSVESIPAKMRMLMWEGGEVEVGEIPDGFVIVGFEMETDRAWSMADKVTINIERPEVKP